MSKIIVPIEMPCDCLSCPFLGDITEMSVPKYGPGIYKKIAKCQFAPEKVEDPWRNLNEFLGHKESWCPLEEVKKR